MIKKERVFHLSPGRENKGGIVYWMSREQRVLDNPGLLYAQHLAIERSEKFMVVFTLVDEFLGATLRQYDFMLRGLYKIAIKLKEKEIPFVLLTGNPPEKMEAFLSNHSIGTVIVDFDPLKIKEAWRSELIRNVECNFIEVDGHNIVPLRYASDKLEYAAYTIRPKIKSKLDFFMEKFPDLKKMSPGNYHGTLFSLEKVLQSLKINIEVGPVKWIVPGEEEAFKVMKDFIQRKLPSYAAERNDPNKNASSDLSPYLHFGQISSQRIAIEVLRNYPSDENSQAFLEELIIRKELSDNYCFYNSNYDNSNGFHKWAKLTIEEHKRDEREYLYSREEFESAATHDPLWNAAQIEMVKRGKMHGYMRMYWAKKILEWSKNISEAMDTAIYLNDKYELDGRDPNGYAGIAWSIGGVHDRAWNERPVFGKIRYMNFNGCKRKFDVDAYIGRVGKL